MKVVLDSNVFVSCLNSFSPYYNIFLGLVRGDFKMAISTDIAFEYQEVFSFKFNEAKAMLFFGLLETSENAIKVEVFYKWNLISADPDDNKFVDCAVSANADYLVTNDKHFNILKQLRFPKVNCITVEEFMEILQKR